MELRTLPKEILVIYTGHIPISIGGFSITNMFKSPSRGHVSETMSWRSVPFRSRLLPPIMWRFSSYFQKHLQSPLTCRHWRTATQPLWELKTRVGSSKAGLWVEALEANSVMLNLCSFCIYTRSAQIGAAENSGGRWGRPISLADVPAKNTFLCYLTFGWEKWNQIWRSGSGRLWVFPIVKLIIWTSRPRQ